MPHDFVVHVPARSLGVFQSLCAAALNATLLAFFAIKLLRPVNPIRFADVLVYHAFDEGKPEHRFWARFVNTAPEWLYNMTYSMELLESIGSASSESVYDTRTSYIRLQVAVSGKPAPVPKLRLCAPKTESNAGKADRSSKDFDEIVLAPPHLDPARSPIVRLNVNGQFGTGDQFFATKEYTLQTIRCGAFENHDNNGWESLGDRVREKELSRLLLKTPEPTARNQCANCQHVGSCNLDVARQLRPRM